MAVMLVAAFGAFLAFLDSTIVNIAFPAIQTYFRTDIGNLSWVLNAYNIVFATFLVAAGRLADLLGRKKMFIYGVLLFTVASGLCAVADTVGQLIVFRVLQGIGAAMLVPASLGLVVEGFEPARRAHGLSLWGAAAAIASGLGPPIGGAIVEASSWRWVFLVNVPLGLLTVLVARRRLVESRASGWRRLPDMRGAALLTAALGLLTLGLIKGPDWGWGSLSTVVSLVVAAVALIGFVLSSRYHPAPLIEPAFLRIQSFMAGNVLTLVSSAGFYAYLLTHVLFLNYVWGYTLLRAGLAVAPAALVAAVVAALAGRVADLRGYRVIVGVGALIWAGSLLWYLERVGPQPDFLGDWLPGQILQGIGVGATLPILGSAAMAKLASGGSYATASAVVSSTRQIGAVIGVALLVILIGTPAPAEAEQMLRRGWAMAAVCFAVVAVGAVFLGRTRAASAEAVTPDSAPPVNPPESQPGKALVSAPGAPTPPSAGVRTPDSLPLLAGLDPVMVAKLRDHAEHVELDAGSYLFHAGETADSLYVICHGRVQVLQNDVVVAELGHGQVIGETGLLIDTPRSASVRALRDCSLLRLTKAEFDKIADARMLGILARMLAARLHQTSCGASRRTTREIVVAVVGVDADAPVAMVATELCAVLSARLRAVALGRVDRDGLERAEKTADRVVLQAPTDDAEWQDFCLRVADRIVLVTSNPAPPTQPLPTRAAGADLVLSGAPATREHRRAWEALITPRSVHAVRTEDAPNDLRALAARIAGRSIGLVLSGGGARAFAHLGVLEELETAGITVDRFAGASIGAIIAALAASGVDAAGVDAQIYEYFVRNNPIGDYTFPSKGLVRGQRMLATLRTGFRGRLVEELPKQFRCVSVDLMARRAVVHRRGLLADVVACSLRLPGLYPPMVYDGALHIDGSVLDNVPVAALAGQEGPVLAVNIASGGGSPSASMTNRRSSPQVPGISSTLMRAIMIGGGTAKSALAQADLVIRPVPNGVGFLEFHQIDCAREAGAVAVREALPQIMALVQR